MTTDPKNLLGATIANRFRVERVLGEGGMGAVFVATQLSLGRLVAVKVIKPQAGSIGQDEEAVRRFERETGIIARLNHPNVVQVVDGGSGDDGTMFLAMELLDGENVRAALKREGTFDTSRALAVAEDVCAALAAAHDQGVIHRDLKAENVMLVRVAGRGELAKVLDFGVAKVTSQVPAPAMTGSGFVVGTPGSIAPEQMLGKNDDVRSDLYAVGVLLFEMLAGQAPFVGSTTMELMMRHLSEPPPRVDDVARLRGRTVAPPVVELVASLLEKEPGRRPADARTLLARLASLRSAGGETLSSTPVPVPSLLPPPAATTLGSRLVAVPATATADDGASLSAPMDPAAPRPAATNPPATNPATTNPAATNPAATNPAATNPAATNPATTTSPTAMAVPLPPSPARLARRRLHRAATLTIVLLFVLSMVVPFFRRHQADRLSLHRAAEAELERAVDAFLELRVDEANAAVERAIRLDPDGAAMAYLLRADLTILSDRSIEFADADNAIARELARRRRGVMALETDTERLARALTILDPDEALTAFALHNDWHSCAQGTFHQLLFATRLTAFDRSDKAEKLFAAADADHEHLLTVYGTTLALVRRGQFDAARTLIDAELLPRGEGNVVVEMLVTELELREGKVDAARARLRNVVARTPHWRARLWMDALGAAQNADWYVDVTDQIRTLLPSDAPLRPDLLQLAGYALAGEGRLQAASTMWDAALAEKTFSGLQKVATLSLAQILALHVGDPVTAARWRARYDADLAAEVVGDDPATERVRALNLVAGILGELAEAHKDGASPMRVADVDERVRRLEGVKQDVPFLTEAAKWHLQMGRGDFDALVPLAAKMPPCWRSPLNGLAAAAQAERATDEGKRNDALARAVADLDVATDPKFVHECVSGFQVFGFLQRGLCAQAAVARAELAAAQHDLPRMTAALATFDALWPHPDDHLPAARRANALRQLAAAVPPPTPVTSTATPSNTAASNTPPSSAPPTSTPSAPNDARR
jgi:serine/threonine-protein kinase